VTRPARASDDTGVSLVELLVAALVGGVVLAVVATVFVSTLRADAAARDRDLATGRVQAISTSLSTSLRDASDVGLETLDGGGAVVRARVPDGSGWSCRAWAVVDLGAPGGTGPDGRFELRVTSYPPLATTATAPAPTAAWGVLADHVEPVRDGESTRPFFTRSGARVDWNLVVASAQQPRVGEGRTAAVSGSAAVRGYAQGGPRCR
jgi:hypothetical protein